MWHADARYLDNGSVSCGNTVVQVNVEHGVPNPGMDHPNSFVLYNKNMCGREDSASPTNHEKGKGHDVTSVNDTSKVKSNQEGEGENLQGALVLRV